MNRKPSGATEVVAACHLCGHEVAETLFRVPDFRHNLGGEFGWQRCPVCGLIYLSPRPLQEEIGLYYPEDYALFRTADQKRRWWHFPLMRRWDMHRRCNAIQRLHDRGRILDVGCATGEFLQAMHRRGWETYGVEPDDGAAEYARQQSGLRVFTGDLKSVSFPDAYFDVVTMWVVLEHLYDPLDVLKEVRRTLNPKGLLVLSVPDPRSLEARLFGPYWTGFDAPRHLYVYTSSILRKLLTKAGFEVGDTDYFQADYYTFLASFEPWLCHVLRRDNLPFVLKAILHFPGAGLMWSPLFEAINRLNRGTIVTVYARPQPSPGG
jgi:SAM-dependent methyltransferase